MFVVVCEDEYWLSVYVLLSRLRGFDGLLLLRPPLRDLLEGGPPAALQEELQRRSQLQKSTIQQLDTALGAFRAEDLRCLVTRPLLSSFVPGTLLPRKRQAAQMSR